MSKLFPIRSSTESTHADREPRLLELDDESTDEVFDALGSETARRLLLELHEGPRPASELADELDTTIQNVQYHLTKLEAADLVTVADTWYAENGAEMDVYAPTDEALVLFAGREPTSSLQRLLRQLIGALGPLAAGAAALAYWVNSQRSDGSAPGSELAGDGGASGADGPSPPPTDDALAQQAPPGGDGSGDGAKADGAGDGDGGDAAPDGSDGDAAADGADGAGAGDGDGAQADVSAENFSSESQTDVDTDVPLDGDAGEYVANTSTPTETPTAVTDAAGTAADAMTADPWVAAGLFVAGGLVALAGLFVVDRVLSG